MDCEFESRMVLYCSVGAIDSIVQMRYLVYFTLTKNKKIPVGVCSSTVDVKDFNLEV